MAIDIKAIEADFQKDLAYLRRDGGTGAIALCVQHFHERLAKIEAIIAPYEEPSQEELPQEVSVN